MIPKTIHYCWFGRGEMPELVVHCIDSWKRHLHGYQLVLWNEDSFDINMSSYTREAYKAKKFAFVADYVRLYALYHHGGIYLDADVEMLRTPDAFLNHRAFTGCEIEESVWVTAVVMAAEKGHPWIEGLLNAYSDKEFILQNGELDMTPITKLVTRLTMEDYGWIPENRYQVLENGLNIYPFEVFCAKNWRTGKITVTDDTYMVHHFSGSWLPNFSKFKIRIMRVLGPDISRTIIKWRNMIRSLIQREMG